MVIRHLQGEELFEMQHGQVQLVVPYGVAGVAPVGQRETQQTRHETAQAQAAQLHQTADEQQRHEVEQLRKEQTTQAQKGKGVEKVGFGAYFLVGAEQAEVAQQQAQRNEHLRGPRLQQRAGGHEQQEG